MKLLKMGCLIVVIIVAVIIVALSNMGTGQAVAVQPTAKPEAKSATVETPVDPMEKKYGMSEASFKSIAYNFAKKTVDQQLHLLGRPRYPFNASDGDCKVFEFEKRDGSKLIGQWVGVNVNSRATAKRDDADRVFPFSATYHYDPQGKNWICSTFTFDGEKIQP